MRENFMQEITMKDYIPLLQTLAGGFLTFSGGWLGTVITQRRQRKIESKSLASAFHGEIKALINIIERRRYIQGIQEAITACKSNQKIVLRVRVTRKYFNVYEKNLDKIGILPNPIPEKIVDFYTVMTAILEDLDSINEESFYEQNAEIIFERLSELNALLKDAVDSGQSVCKRIKDRKMLVG
jgi:hypothetical protein